MAFDTPRTIDLAPGVTRAYLLLHRVCPKAYADDGTLVLGAAPCVLRTHAVDEFMRSLDHPFKNEIQAIRTTILAADPTIAEGIKWNAPSYRTREYFATTSLREKKGVGVILHPGAKVRSLPDGSIAIDDPGKLLKWLGKDRAVIVFESREDFGAKRQAFEQIVHRRAALMALKLRRNPSVLALSATRPWGLLIWPARSFS